MEFIELTRGIELRTLREGKETEGKGSLLAKAGWTPDGDPIIQMQKGDQLIQCVFDRDGRIHVGCFILARANGKIVSVRKISERVYRRDCDLIGGGK